MYVYGLTLISQKNLWYYVYNGHGDVVKYFNASETVLKSYEYDAFGEEVDPSTSDTNPFRYAGQYYDTENGTYYLRGRYYNPATGRFTQQDVWGYGNPGDPLSLNLYVYCYGNPVLYMDYDGRIGILAGMAIGAVVGAVIGGIADLGGQLIANEGDFSSVNWRSVGASAVSGGLTGTMGVITGGMSTVGGAFAAGALTGGVGYGSYHLINGSETSFLDWVSSMVSGGFLASVSYKYFNKNSLKNSEINTPNEFSASKKQLGKKYGEHRKDYPDMKNYQDYLEYAQDIFDAPDFIVKDSINNEVYYIRGNDLLRIDLDGNFVSLYPGAQSDRVLNAIKNEGVLWVRSSK